ncbi:MAG: NAD(P)-binding domain-containing protein, partial [Tannerella sp.]|nr:NAD(P)-binding domain-containing protein [Tannerella sp.]
MRTVIIGSGNVATAMAVAMQDAGFDIIQVFSRTEENAAALAEKIVGSTAKTNIAEITAS